MNRLFLVLISLVFFPWEQVGGEEITIAKVWTESGEASILQNNEIWRVRIPSPHEDIQIQLEVPETMKEVRVRLFGVDEGWREVPQNGLVRYQGIESGYYIFLIEARNVKGEAVQRASHFRLQSPRQVVKRQKALLRGILLALLFFALIVLVILLLRRGKKRDRVARLLLSSTEKERSRIAAELHDGIGQNLLVIKNLATMARRSLDQEKSYSESLQSITETVSQTLDETRAIVRDLRPPELDRLG